MALIKDVRDACDRLAPLGWGDLLEQVTDGKLKIKQSSNAGLAAALDARLTTIDRSVPGFEDFASDGEHGIESGSPARSLLYHALSSPLVTASGGVTLGGFPTLKELENVENYVFAKAERSLADVKALPGGNTLAVVVFARQYRNAKDTTHRKHADLAFSRTGISRVGSSPANYDDALRGWLPFVDGQLNAIRVLPTRFSVFLAVRRRGSAANSLPMRFRGSDSNRNFWVPVHKLFDGSECLKDGPLTIDWATRHVNEKLRRVHRQLQQEGIDTGVSPDDLDKDPFIFEKGIAELSNDNPGLLVPSRHPALVQAARFKGQPLGFKVPPGRARLSSSFEISANGRFRSAPEYVHARLDLDTNEDLNDFDNVSEIVNGGGYTAQHYIDFTGDGWVTAEVKGLGEDLGDTRAAYSLVTAPDFYPGAGQRELTEWAASLPSTLRNVVWQTPPGILSDGRDPANLQLPDSPFDAAETTITSVVGLAGSGTGNATSTAGADVVRHSPLPDDSAGVFLPGWEVSVDQKGSTPHLAAYGLGSPFPEDAKLCAALSTFWPGAAPDATRGLEPELTSVTVSPMTDEEIGRVGNLPWDGVPGPRLVTENGIEFAEYARFDQADYIKSALEGLFSISLTAQVGIVEYQARVLSMALVYLADRINPRRRLVLSFRSTTPGDGELLAAESEASKTLIGKVFRFELIDRDSNAQKVGTVWRARVTRRNIYFCAPDQRVVLQKRPGQRWREVPIAGV